MERLVCSERSRLQTGGDIENYRLRRISMKRSVQFMRGVVWSLTIGAAFLFAGCGSGSSTLGVDQNTSAGSGDPILYVDDNASELLAPLVGGLLGTGTNLDLVGLEGLAGTDVDLLGLLGGAGDLLGVGTVQELLDSTLNVGELLGLLSGLLGESGDLGAQGIVNDLLGTLAGDAILGTELPLGDLFQVPDALLTLAPSELLSAGGLTSTVIDALQLVGSIAEVSRFVLEIPIDIPLNLPPLVDSMAKIQITNPPHIAILAEGVTVESAAARIYLDLKVGLADLGDLTNLTTALGSVDASVADSGLVNEILALVDSVVETVGLGDLVNLGNIVALDGDILRIPLYLEVGTSAAELVSVSPTEINVDVTKGLAKAFIGDIDTSMFFSTSVLEPTDFGPADIVNLGGLVSISGKAYLESPGLSQDIKLSGLQVPQVQDLFAPFGTSLIGLLQSLFQNMELNVELLGMTLLEADDLKTIVGPAINVLLGRLLPIFSNGVLDPLSSLLGLFAGGTEGLI